MKPALKLVSGSGLSRPSGLPSALTLSDAADRAEAAAYRGFIASTPGPDGDAATARWRLATQAQQASQRRLARAECEAMGRPWLRTVKP